MKNISKVILINVLIILSLTFSIAYASNSLILSKNYTFKGNQTRTIQNNQIKVYIGQKDIVRYQKDGDIKITPEPVSTEVDDYGNEYAYFDVSKYKKGREITISVTREFEPGFYSGEIAKRSEATIDDYNSRYVEPEEYIESDDSEIIAKAKEITYGLSSDYKRALALFEYVNTKLTYDNSAAYAGKGALSALQTGRGVCEEYATLYAALCRSLGIPCKLITGYKVSNKLVKEAEEQFDIETGERYTVDPVYEYELEGHVWNEIWLDDYGWLPVDACVVYTKNGTRSAYLDSFLKIDGKDYIAEGLYAGKVNNLEYSSEFALVDDEISLVAASEYEAPVKHKFTDLAGYEWAEPSINMLYEFNVIKGYSDTEFGPGGNITRIEFICLLARVLKQLNYAPITTGRVYYYPDYDKTHYSKQEYDFLMRCLEELVPYDRLNAGYAAMDGIFGKTLDINKAITRAEVVALMENFLRRGSSEDAEFSDINNHKFRSAIVRAYSNKIINGYEDGTFRPDNPIKRAEIAVILDRYLGA